MEVEGGQGGRGGSREVEGGQGDKVVLSPNKSSIIALPLLTCCCIPFLSEARPLLLPIVVLCCSQEQKSLTRSKNVYVEQR